MKSILFILLFLGNTLFANDAQLESAIFNKILTAVTAKEHPKVYIHTHNDALKKYPGSLVLVNNCKDANAVILSTLNNLSKACRSKILFGTRYIHLQNPDVIGAFFWQKGRPNILFYRDRLAKKHIKLDASFEKYIEDE